MRDKGGHSAHREPALLRIRRSSGLSNGLTRAREKEARCALPPSVSDAEAVQKRCGSGVEAVQKRCRSGAEAMQKRCGSDAEAMYRLKKQTGSVACVYVLCEYPVTQ